MGSKAEQRLEDLYRSHASLAARLALLLTGDEDVAQDITQQAFVRIAPRLSSLRHPDRAAGYLYRTIHNLARSHGRRLSARRKLERKLHRSQHSHQPDLGTKDEVIKALMQISPRQRTALFLRYYLDLSEAQAAEILECSTSAMKSLTHRAADALRSQLEGGSS